MAEENKGQEERNWFKTGTGNADAGNGGASREDRGTPTWMPILAQLVKGSLAPPSCPLCWLGSVNSTQIHTQLRRENLN